MWVSTTTLYYSLSHPPLSLVYPITDRHAPCDQRPPCFRRACITCFFFAKGPDPVCTFSCGRIGSVQFVVCVSAHLPAWPALERVQCGVICLNPCLWLPSQIHYTTTKLDFFARKSPRLEYSCFLVREDITRLLSLSLFLRASRILFG